MFELSNFQVDEQKTFQNIVVKNEVDIKMLRLGTDAVLTGKEGKPFTEFEQEVFRFYLLTIKVADNKMY